MRRSGVRRSPFAALARSSFHTLSPQDSHLAGEVVGKIPTAERPRLKPDEHVVARRFSVLLTRLRAEIAGGDAGGDRSLLQRDEAGRRAQLAATVRRAIVADRDGRPGCVAEGADPRV